MAHFGLRASYVSRGRGQSAIASAAYQARERLLDPLTGEIKHYYGREDVLFKGVYAPKSTPAWAGDRARLWAAYEAHDTRKNASLARKFLIDLPCELTPEANRYLLQDWIKENFLRKGLAVDLAIHRPPKGGDARNIHAHVMVTMLPLDASGFVGKKERLTGPQRKAELETLRQNWAHHANRHLERWGHAARIDHRSNEDRGLDAEPTRHLGPDATDMQRRGKTSTRAARQTQDRAERTTTRAQLRKLLAELDAMRMTQAQIAEQAEREREEAYARALDRDRGRQR